MTASLSERLSALGLYATASGLDDLLARAARARWGAPELLEYLVEEEAKERARKSLERRLSRSRLGRFKPMSDFDWAWPKRIDREAVDAALQLSFLEAARNVVIVAPQGLGKTMMAQNIAHQAVLKGHSVLFVTASQMLLDLGGQDSARGLDRRLRHYCRAGLLILDEVGYLSYDSRNADLLFQVVSRRYEQKSLVLTTNLPFSEWTGIFPNAACATALIDRVVHHADIISIEGQSYRRRAAEQTATARRAKTKS